MEHVNPTSRKTLNHESVMSQGIVGTVSTVLMQCSPDIGKVHVERGWGGWAVLIYIHDIEEIHL